MSKSKRILIFIENRWSCGSRVQTLQCWSSADKLWDSAKPFRKSLWHSFRFPYSIPSRRSLRPRSIPPFAIWLGSWSCICQVCSFLTINKPKYNLFFFCFIFSASDPYLCLRIDPIPLEQTVEEWDLINIPVGDFRTVKTKGMRSDPSLQIKFLTKVSINFLYL